MIHIKTYYIEQKLISINSRYCVYNSNGKLYLDVTTKGILPILDRLLGSIFSVGHSLYVNRLDGSEFSIIRKNTALISGKYIVYCDGKNLASIKQFILSLKPKVSITTKDYTYLVDGDIMAKNFIVYHDSISVARITKSTYKIKDRYKIDIFDDNNANLFLLAVIVIDNSIHS